MFVESFVNLTHSLFNNLAIQNMAKQFGFLFSLPFNLTHFRHAINGQLLCALRFDAVGTSVDALSMLSTALTSNVFVVFIH